MTQINQNDKPFEYLLSKEQLTFLKDLKAQLKIAYKAPIDEDAYDEDLKEHLIIKALFSLPVADLNLYLIKTFGKYSSNTALANELLITKQTVCNHIRKTKTYITEYVLKHIHNRNYNH